MCVCVCLLCFAPRGVTETINGVALLVLLTLSLSTFASDLGIGALFQRILSGAVR